MKRHLTAILFCMLGSTAFAAESPDTHDADGRMLFAFDDHQIPWLDNLQVTLVQAEKYPGNPVLRCGPKGSPDYGHAILYGSVIRINGKFRMWYLGMVDRNTPDGLIPGWWRPMCYAESDDGIHWTKPELGLVELHGNKKNNICLIESDPFSLSRVNDFLSVLYEPNDPDPARRYKTVYIAHMPMNEVRGGHSKVGIEEGRWGSLVCATSADGLSWKVVGDRPANAGGERFEVTSIYRFGDLYYAGGQLISPWTWLPGGREAGRVMMLYRSPDFNTWSRAKALAFARPGQLAEPPVYGQQTHMGVSIWNRGNVLVGLYGQWQDAPADQPKGKTGLLGLKVDLGFAMSDDGIHFREPVPGFKTIQRGKQGSWDDIALLQGHAFANVGDKTYIWYSHWDCEDKFRSPMEIGLAMLRRDGFGYLAPRVKGDAAHFITSRIEPSREGQRLLVNADGLTPEAPLTVELLDTADRPIPGFSGADAAKLTASGTQLEVAWPKQQSNRMVADKPFAVKVSFPATGETRVYTLKVVK
jgi:hypothetical protein